LGAKNDNVGRVAETAGILAAYDLAEIRAPIFRAQAWLVLRDRVLHHKLKVLNPH
jgi:hypothetical protein